MDLIDILNWRYAVKKFDDRKVSAARINEIVKSISLSASSTGMQPYRLFLIDDEQIRKELASDSFNAQIVEASHLLVFAAFDSINKQRIDDMISLMAKQREVPERQLADYKKNLETYLLARTDEENHTWSAKQAYIALGTGLIAAANLEVDATPMEGFNSKKLDTLLNLQEMGLKSVVLLALGYRDEEKDFLATQKKVRLPISEFLTKI